MSRKNPSANNHSQRLFLFVGICSILGVVLGGTASHAEMQQCLTAETPSNECLTQDPTIKVVEGMSGGLVAGAGAAIAVTWQSWQKK
ncbi:hypothetical protein H6G89_15635 [Oscillatoria sp. FACHB-1407]|uniref:hypothetical protein n=1 Tax=Oscillatoria sp. FACHB-1407 TaxID=2692847 RepID=UPI001684345D|nr:hypothetical protein [Oscillatoria sp. FACHB-1407]MBD2462477.1 hypothetical protein [Oscillatoria sp. FACHB-1407]